MATMKARWFLAWFFFALTATTGVEGAQDKTITKVVKLLQKMLTKSKEEGEADRLAYAKYACYVATSKAEKTESIKKLTEQIDLLESKIAELQATNGALASEVAQLATDMSINEAEQKQATEIREASEKNFKSMEEELEKSFGEMQEAIDVLSSIGFVQAKSRLGHVKFMAGSGKDKKKAVLMNLGSEVKNALRGAAALLPPEKRTILEGFLQSPSAAASGNAGDIIGIMEDLLGTFKTNLANARKAEKAEKAAFEAAIQTLKESHEKMKTAHDDKEAEMGTNDAELSAKKTQLEEAIKQKESDEEFLEKLEEMATQKEKDYDERKMLRANEEAAIAEAIAILNSDNAFDTFGEVDATSTGSTSFLQLRQRAGVRQQAETVLDRAAGESKSSRLARVAASLRKGNPFTVVLEEIDKIEKVIKEEGVADQEKKDWCEKEQKNSKADLEEKKSEIETLNGEIDKLDETINDPKTGLKVQIPEKEAALVQNAESQKEETEDRKKENAAYKADVLNLVEAEDLLDKAIKVLKKYYETLAARKKSLMQQQEDPTPPETFSESYKGQSSSGNEAISMLEFILSETKKEHQTADDDEAKALKEYEESMAELKKQEAEMQEALVTLKETLAEKEKELEEKQVDLKDTTHAKESIEKYLLEIKPGCDFIQDNFDLREANRKTELDALEKAVTLIKGTPAYKDAEAKDAALAAGKCKSDCSLDKTSLKCKACMAGESEEAFCKTNPRMAGCV